MQPALDSIFAALSSPTRRAMLDRLAAGPATVTDLAAPFALTQPTISAHLKVLEAAGLIRRGRQGTARPVIMAPEALATAHRWISDCERFWAEGLARLEDYARHLQNTETDHDRHDP
jgi:DNA-binding transcriptional ArsR family regulator